MKTKENLMICTIAELAKYLANSISIQDIPDSQCPNVDFAVIDLCDIDNFDKVYSNVTGWHGLKVIDTGFNSSCLNIVADYYGGGSAAFTQISPDDSLEEVKNHFKKVIIKTLDCLERIEDNSFLLVEFADKITFEEFWETGEIVSFCSEGECPICDDILAELKDTPFSELKKDEEMYEHAEQLYHYYLAK